METFATYAINAYAIGAVITFVGTCFLAGAGRIDTRGLDVPMLGFLALANAGLWPVLAVVTAICALGTIFSEGE